MPNKVEVILQINIDRVSCPGVWLCQDGHVALLVFAFGNGYQTRYLPPMFPLNFKDTFYFKKQFTDLCTLDNLGYLLKDETIYCELVQINDCCGPVTKPVILAQYLGSLSEVLFPPNVCITEGVDLLMKRTDHFPGILAPKVEISTRVRIDHSYKPPDPEPKPQPFQHEPCRCADGRQSTVCHSPQYHRVKCSRYIPRSVSTTKSCKGVNNRECRYNSRARSKSPPKWRPPPRMYCAQPPNNNDCLSQCVYRVATPPVDFRNLGADSNVPEREDGSSTSPKAMLESRFIAPSLPEPQQVRSRPMYKQKRCTCEICKRYFEMFYKDRPSSC